ncbi:hypothetical protein, partial [Mycobacterium avium]|uniref:hypothetical protein n=1 Tax=Mycobacterium avium TaxID=1764 RepID=UPI001E38EB9E
IDVSSASRATVPSAYLHPRFQGQEPPGFPGRFTGGAPAAVRAEFAAVSCRLIDTAIRVLLSPLRRPPRFGLSSAADVYRELAQRN